ncbi:hypothetical protein V5J35_001798 [Endozoicomonas sp. NE40]|uniref:Uncharacterized protein n=1 Tax=Endozoicomonas lisbonensis TaxID=3120522 RepID=A0ABV2SFR6_9GAMM
MDAIAKIHSVAPQVWCDLVDFEITPAGGANKPELSAR